MALSDFVNGFTSVSLYSRYSLSSHSVRVAQKNVAQHKELFVSTKKLFHIGYVASENYVSRKKNMLWQQKKLCDPKKETHVE